MNETNLTILLIIGQIVFFYIIIIIAAMIPARTIAGLSAWKLRDSTNRMLN